MPTTAGDLINLTPLVISDTFQTWYDRTNQVISGINPLQVYDIDSGAGILKQTGLSAGNYNGVITVSLNPGPGLGTRTINGQSLGIVDFALFNTYSLQLTGPGEYWVQPEDEIIVNDQTDGKARSVRADHMLPSTIIVGTSLPLTISGNVNLQGNLTLVGGNSFIASQNLRVQNKQIDIAYQESIPLTLTGVSGSSFAAGVTAYHFNSVSGLTPDLYGHIISFTGPNAGTTGIAVIGYPFGNNQQASDFFGLTGYISKSATGSPVRHLVTSTGVVSSAFLGDVNLSQAGIVAHGASSDKTFLWYYTDTDTGNIYNAWMSNTNLGVLGTNSSVISRFFRSYGFSGSSVRTSEFIFASEFAGSTGSAISLGELNSDASALTGTSWRIERNPSNNNLIFSTGTGGNGTINQKFLFTDGPSGQTFSGITANNFAYLFNADMVDGAHASLTAAAFRIPIAGSNGYLDDSWGGASSLRKNVNLTGHGLTFGNILRITTTGNYVKALADTSEDAETVGIVSGVNTANQFVLTYKGYISGLSGPRDILEKAELTPGAVYFLSGTTAGALIADPDYAPSTKLSVGQVRKPMLIALSTTEGYLTNQIGAKVATPTDELYLDGLVPIGTIYPYTGNMSFLSSEWLLCDGQRYLTSDYPELYSVISNNYYATGTATATNKIYLDGGSRGLQISDQIYIVNLGLTKTISAISGSEVTVNGTDLTVSTIYKVKAVQDVSARTIFFVPDLRTRTILGGSTGTGGLAVYTLGNLGGSEYITLTPDQLPSHSHTISAKQVGVIPSGTSENVANNVGAVSINTDSTGDGDIIDTHTPYLVLNYIIRAKAQTKATILTGHNHDNRYIRYDAIDSGLTQTNRDLFKVNASVSGIALGSTVTGDYHNHDGRYARIDITGNPVLALTSQYNGRYNLASAAYGEGDIYLTSLAAGQTQHNHDGIYPRYDSAMQPLFTEANRNYFVNTRIRALNLSGGVMSGGGITFSGNNGFISGLTYPNIGSQAANKEYVDTRFVQYKYRTLFDGLTRSSGRRAISDAEITLGFTSGGYFWNTGVGTVVGSATSSLWGIEVAPNTNPGYTGSNLQTTSTGIIYNITPCTDISQSPLTYTESGFATGYWSVKLKTKNQGGLNYTFRVKSDIDTKYIDSYIFSQAGEIGDNIEQTVVNVGPAGTITIDLKATNSSGFNIYKYEVEFIKVG